jgi:hypothetical protein
MNKGTIIGVILLLAAFGATAAVYFLYFQTRLTELKEHQTAMNGIHKRLTELGTTFSNTQPPVVVDTWNQGLQPWIEAVLARTDFFNIAEVPEQVDVPEDDLHKFFYMEKHPQLQKELMDYAYNNACYLGAFDFGVPDRTTIGPDPSREDVAKWLTRYEFGSAVTKLLITNNASYIENVVLWPMKATNVGTSRGAGSIESFTAGVRFAMTLEELANFLETLRTEQRYFSVDAIRIANTQLRNPGARLEISMLLTQARYSDKSTAPTVSATPATSRARGSFRNRMSGIMGGRSRTVAATAEEESWWQGFKKKYLPFL